MRIGIAQINPIVGDLRGNFEKILAAYERLVAAGAELVLAPELAITGYPPQDLVFRSRFVPQNLEVLERLHQCLGAVPLLVGYVDRNEGRGKPFFNAAALLERGQPILKSFKTLLPTYDVFDEDRYFEPGSGGEVFVIAGRQVGVTICEDIWTQEYLPRPLYDRELVAGLVAKGAEIIVNLSASPFSVRKLGTRREMVAKVARTHQCPIVYCNVVGGNDELVFDGSSIAFNCAGELIAQLSSFQTVETVVDTDSTAALPPPSDDLMAELFGALSLGVRDYLTKCNFKSAVLGLSGGIDSAVVAAIAVDALGLDNVLGVSMPSPYSSRGSIDDALALAHNLGIRCLQIPIGDAFLAFKAQFKKIFAGLPEDATEENMQSRLRGMILMALSNKFGHLLLTTGNKSELAVGYCTIYGDMAGGLAVISDVPKTLVYRLARWINRESEIIPKSTIEKPPSAELKPGQVDQDSLPPYDVLDQILQLYVEENLSGAEIIARGFEEKTVRWIQRRVDLNEYKRAQAAPGLKVTSRAFGLGRKMPIAQQYIDIEPFAKAKDCSQASRV
ncbi:MAG TPA: NAD+ synthase [Chthoniobacteraceae bacterium]|nr:NAD+ synthase [Chthoniobacteraceae bacterium]